MASARLYVASRGIFQFYINGQKVGNDYWGTGWTDYKIRIQANTYDVTKMLVEDDTNTLSAVIANGWYAGQNCWGHCWKDMYGIVPELLAQLEITYKTESAKFSRLMCPGNPVSAEQHLQTYMQAKNLTQTKSLPIGNCPNLTTQNGMAFWLKIWRKSRP